MRLIKQNDTSKPLAFLLVSSSDHISGVLGATPVVTISKNGASFATPTGTVSEIGNGWYKLIPSPEDVATLGPLLLHATASGADPVDLGNLCTIGVWQQYNTAIIGNQDRDAST